MCVPTNIGIQDVRTGELSVAGGTAGESPASPPSSLAFNFYVPAKDLEGEGEGEGGGCLRLHLCQVRRSLALAWCMMRDA